MLIYPIFGNWAFIAMILALLFYFRLSFSMGIKMFLFALGCLVLNSYLASVVSIFWFSLSLFIFAWVGQFYGHKIEGKKPSFLKDLQFLIRNVASLLLLGYNTLKK